MRLHGMMFLAGWGLAGCAGSNAPVSLAAGSEAETLVERSRAYHDPDGRWWDVERHIRLEQPRSDGTSRHTQFVLYPDDARFQHAAQDGKHWTRASVNGEDCQVELSDDPGERFKGFDCKKAHMYHRYYSYLFNLPMNLTDGGELLPKVTTRMFAGRTVNVVRVSYGKDEPVWDHFFDPDTGATVGCSFSTNGEEKDGEYIIYEGEVEADGIRLPQTRTWYTWAEDKELGADRIMGFEVVGR